MQPSEVRRVRRAVAIAFTALIAADSILLSGNAFAQDKYPARPLVIVVPFGAGSSTDVSVRMLAARVQPRFGQPVLVENRAGGGATIGPAYVAKSRPDGYTILNGTTSGIAAAPGMVKSLSYDPIRDFSGITVIGEQYTVLLTRGEFKELSFPQFLERIRKNPERFAIAGQSASYQILNQMMTDAAKLTHTYVPYAEVGRMMNDLWGGRLGGAMVTLSLALPAHKSGQGYIVAISATERMPGLPKTPAMAETLPGAHLNSWSGYFVPARTPRPIINILHAHMAEAVRDPEILKRNEEGGRPLFLTPEETDAYVRKEVPRWTALLKAAGIEPE